LASDIGELERTVLVDDGHAAVAAAWGFEEAGKGVRVLRERAEGDVKGRRFLRHVTEDDASVVVDVGHTPRVLMQGRKKSRRRTPSRIPLYSY
jgi:UDP-N-acetylmuramyl tripeptide synthase